MSRPYLFLFLILSFLTLPLSAKRQKVSSGERAQAVMRIHDLLQSGQWVMVIDNITTTNFCFTQLLPERNYFCIEDGRLIRQTDITGAHRSDNLNAFQRKEVARYADIHPDYFASLRPVVRLRNKVESSSIRTNRKGTKVVYTLYISSDYAGKNSFVRIVVDPITLAASDGWASGHIVPHDKFILSLPSSTPQ